MTLQEAQVVLHAGGAVAMPHWPRGHFLTRQFVQGRWVFQATPGVVLETSDLNSDKWVSVGLS
jgi:hypothetical protein